MKIKHLLKNSTITLKSIKHVHNLFCEASSSVRSVQKETPPNTCGGFSAGSATEDFSYWSRWSNILKRCFVWSSGTFSIPLMLKTFIKSLWKYCEAHVLLYIVNSSFYRQCIKYWQSHSVLTFPKEIVWQILFRLSVSERLWRRVEQLKHVTNDLPQAVLQRKVIVHQIDQKVIIMNVLDDHPWRGLVFIEFGPLFDPQGEGLVLRKTQGQVWWWGPAEES